MENNNQDSTQRNSKQSVQPTPQQTPPPVPNQTPVQPPQQYQPPQTYQPQANNYHQTQPKLYPPIKIGEWIGVMIIMVIPLINFIMLLVWAFGNGNPSKANWAKATLLIGVIGGVLAVMIYLIVLLIAGLSF